MNKIAAAIVALALLAGCAWGQSSSPTQQQPAALQPTQPAATLSDTVVSEAVVLPLESVELSWLTSGTVQTLLVHEGDKVAKDAPLARLDTRELELQVASAQVALQSAQARR